MARGLWRSWVERDGVDVWSARAELRRGEWIDVEQTAYEANGHQPPFWDLPLKDDYMAAGMIEPIEIQFYKADLKMMPPTIIVLIILGGLAFALYVAWWALMRA